MKKNNLFLISTIVFSVITFLVVGYFLYNIFFSNNELKMVQTQYPLDQNHAYVIYPNLSGKEHHTNTNFEADLFYTFAPWEEIKNNQIITDKLVGRIISIDTTFDFSSYLDKPVYIKGKFKYGLPKLTEQDHNPPDSFTKEQPVLKIDSLTLVEAQ